MKRYDVDLDGESHIVDDGLWVRFDDHVAWKEKARQQLKEELVNREICSNITIKEIIDEVLK